MIGTILVYPKQSPICPLKDDGMDRIVRDVPGLPRPFGHNLMLIPELRSLCRRKTAILFLWRSVCWVLVVDSMRPSLYAPRRVQV